MGVKSRRNRPPAAIDWRKPLRLKKNGRQVYVVGRNDNGDRILGTEDRWGSGGLLYRKDGRPVVDGTPWGEVENFDAFEEMKDGEWKDEPRWTEKQAALAKIKAEKKRQEAEARRLAKKAEERRLVEALEANPLFGAW